VPSGTKRTNDDNDDEDRLVKGAQLLLHQSLIFYGNNLQPGILE